MRKIFLTLLLSMMALSAHAADQSGWVGVLGGMTVPSYNGATARPVFGVSGGAKLGSEFGIGGYYLTSTKDESSNNVSFKLGMDLYGVEGGYFFEGEAAGVMLGARLGMSKVTVGSLSTSPMHFGVVAGLDKSLGPFSIGGEISYLVVSSSSTSGVNIDGFNLLNFMATAKLWF